MTDSVTLALPSKGAISEPTLNFLKDSGLKVSKLNPRQYTGSISVIPSVNVLFQRVKDVLYKVADGTAQLGITGYDVVREYGSEDVVVIHETLGYGHCELVVAVPESWVDVESIVDLVDVALDFREQQGRNIRIATTYTTLTRQYLHEQGIHHFSLVKADGAIEAAPTIGYADLVVDLVQTGTTLRENHLKQLEDGVIVRSQACLIGNRHALKTVPAVKHAAGSMLEYIDAAMHGKHFYQVTVNIQGADAETVAHKVASHEFTKGLKGPTVAPIYSVNGGQPGDEHWFTVTITIHTRDLLAAVQHVREMGGMQVVVTPVHYVFLQESPTFARLDELL